MVGDGLYTIRGSERRVFPESAGLAARHHLSPTCQGESSTFMYAVPLRTHQHDMVFPKLTIKPHSEPDRAHLFRVGREPPQDYTFHSIIFGNGWALVDPYTNFV